MKWNKETGEEIEEIKCNYKKIILKQSESNKLECGDMKCRLEPL